MATKSFKIYISSFILLIISIILDQFTKYLAQTHLPDNSIDIIDGVFSLTYLENRGVGFGLLQNKMYLILVFNILVLFLIAYFFIKIPKNRRYFPIRILTTLIVAGAIGNIIDRIRLGYVIDFFYFELINFPIFNVADIYVSVSVVLLVILFLFVYTSEELDSILTFGMKKESSGGDNTNE